MPLRAHAQSYLADTRVLEIADEQAEYAGKLLAGLGADVIKVEPPEGGPTRRYGPFLDGEPHPDRSLYFWHYNFGKRGAALDLETRTGRDTFLTLAAKSDVMLESTPKGYLDGAGVGYEQAKTVNPNLVWVRISPFGDDGPWGGYKGSDLVHMALGGVMMNTGYDRDPITGDYDMPPVSPQMWHAYHVAGQHAVLAAIGALTYRRTTGLGQHVSVPVHQAISTNTEMDAPAWVYQRQPFYRQTCRHSGPTPTPMRIAQLKDGRYMMPTVMLHMRGTLDRVLGLLNKYGAADDLNDEQYQDPAYVALPHVQQHINDVVFRFVGRTKFEGPWREGQNNGLLWVPLRKPEENLDDDHWKARRTFREVEHPELGRSFTYVWAPWLDDNAPWREGPPAPLTGDAGGLDTGGDAPVSVDPRTPSVPPPLQRSARGKPFALNNVRIIDFTWWLASGGGPRFLAALGAELIKVEWRGHWDIRWGQQMPPGGRAERDAADAPCAPEPNHWKADPDYSGSFNDINTGKRGVSLNMNHPKGKEVLRRLIGVADVVAEGFSPGVMRSWGFDYERMKAVNPTIIYVQQSGMGQQGTYGPYRATGPTAQSLSGLSEMSGLPEPHLPVGVGYSYLDWFGAYNIATSMAAAVYQRERTGKGTYIDASQVEIGLYLTGTATLDYVANGTPWKRYGNRSPWKLAAPSGAYRCRGDDRWIAITCHDDAEWQALRRVLGDPAWAAAPEFSSLASRLEHQDRLDALLDAEAQRWEPYELMHAAQAAGVPAGVCQTAEDRFDHDPQLRHLGWTTELNSTKMGRWPIKEFPAHLTETPTYIGGPVDRSAPGYGEDDDYVYGDVLGMSSKEIQALRDEDVI